MESGDFNLPFHTKQRTFRYYPGWKIPDNLTEFPYMQKPLLPVLFSGSRGFFRPCCG